MTITLPALSVCTALAASLLVAAPAAADPPGVIVAAGTIRATDGTPFRAGAPVSLWASTPSTTLEVGDSVASAAVASTTVGTGGAFELRVPSIADVAALASRDGLVDFEVRALDGTAYAPHSFTREVAGSGAAAVLVEPGTAPVTAGSRSAAPSPAGAPLAVTALPTPADPAFARPAVSPATARATQVCGETRVADLGSRQVRVGSTSAASGIVAEFTFASGASSSIGAGFSTSGKAGSWSKGGTSTVKSTTTIAYGKRSGSHVYLTTYRFGKYSQWCYPINVGSTGKRILGYKVRADQFRGGSSMLTGLAPAATKCTKMHSGGKHTQTKTTANTWSSGVSTPTLLNISVTSRAGYTTTAKVFVENKSGRDRQICGTHDYIGGNPQRIVAK